jgi:multidrug efflux pump subunit AcrB
VGLCPSATGITGPSWRSDVGKYATGKALRGLQNDVYCEIGLVMLIGLATKNAILIVEFAEQLRAQGLTLVEAAVEAARIRLRPILMTSFAFILGLIPLVARPRALGAPGAFPWAPLFSAERLP